MSVTIKLDRPALRGLIDEDSELKFELTNAVVSEVIRKVFEKDMARLVKEASPELFKRAVAAMQDRKDLEQRITESLDQQLVVRAGWGMPKLSPALQAMFSEGVLGAQDQLKLKIDNLIHNYITDQAQAIVDAKLAEVDIDTRIAKRVDRMLNEEIDKKVREHHDALLKKMKEALA